jgi:hypothetical protein
MGIWSGRGRKVEIAESFLQCLVTMLRRDGKFRRTGDAEITLRDDGEGQELRSAWHAWIHQESFKRIAFRLVQHDTNSSMALLVNPLISYAEVQLPFPDSPALWLATSADQWKVALLSLSNSWAMSLVDYLENPEALNNPDSSADIETASLALLSCAWNLTWESIQLSMLQGSKSQRRNLFLTSSRKEDILKLLNHLRLSMSNEATGTKDVTMRLEHISLHLHMTFEHLQTYAGMDGPEQARLISPVIAEWAQGESARHAVWHAGQIIHVARRFPKAMIQGPIAIMIFHASLALWVYGLQSENRKVTNSWATNDTDDLRPTSLIFLDGQMNLQVQRFTQFGSGIPCVQDGNQSDGLLESQHNVYLSQPDKIMELVIEITSRNHHGLPRPQLVDGLIQLMGSLQMSSQRGGNA